MTGVNAIWGALRVTLIGALAAAAAFGVAKLFGTIKVLCLLQKIRN